MEIPKLFKMRPTRFAHVQGHTDVCYSDNGKYIITCGMDGEVRIFEGLDDDDCKTHTVAQCSYCVAFKDNCVLVGTDLNMIQSITFDEGKANGIVTRFTSFPTHIQMSPDKNIIAIAASDMTIKVHDAVNFKDFTFIGHTAPLLSVSIDPLGDFLASSSCDGTIKVWNFRTQSVVRSFNLIPKCNDFLFSKTLCRLTFTPDGLYLIIPVDLELLFYNRNDWKAEFKLVDSSIDSIVSVTAISPCGAFVAVGCRNGRIVVWNLKTKTCILSEVSPNSMALTGLAWNPVVKDELAFVNIQGELGTMEHIFDGKEDPSLDLNNVICTVKPIDPDAGENDDGISLAKIKSDLGFADDEDGTFLGLPFSEKNEGARAQSLSPVPHPTSPSLSMPPCQKPFQPGMTPEHLRDRCMVWNNVGVVRQYKNDEENSIEVEFHDSSIHHPFHLNNFVGYSIAALNEQALVLAAESQDDQLSKLSVHQFSVFDGSKEWEIEMLEGEELVALGIGKGWIAAASNQRNLRVFGTSGFQKDVLCLPGPVVCLSGSGPNIMILYHSGIGVLGEQSIFGIILNLSGGVHPVPIPMPIPLSPRSYVAWAGYTDEGTPLIMDSAGIIKIFTYKNGHLWTPVLNTRQITKGKNDNLFLIGASEVRGVIRGILCKGSHYPPILPRPHVSLLQFHVPLCESSGEKGTCEEALFRARLLSSMTARLDTHAVDVEAVCLDVQRRIRENVLKLVALACGSDHEARAYEVCEVVPYEMIKSAIKYATKIRRMQLAERLSNLLNSKLEEKQGIEYGLDNGPKMRVFPEEGICSKGDATESFEDENSKENQSSFTDNPILAAAARRNWKGNLTARQYDFSPFQKNPFKKMGDSCQGILLTNSKEQKSVLSLKPIIRRPKGKPTAEPVMAMKKTSALQLWLQDNKELVKKMYPDASDTELFVKAAFLFKDVEDAVKQKYKRLAAVPDSVSIEDGIHGCKRNQDGEAGEFLNKKQKSIAENL